MRLVPLLTVPELSNDFSYLRFFLETKCLSFVCRIDLLMPNLPLASPQPNIPPRKKNYVWVAYVRVQDVAGKYALVNDIGIAITFAKVAIPC